MQSIYLVFFYYLFSLISCATIPNKSLESDKCTWGNLKCYNEKFTAFDEQCRETFCKESCSIEYNECKTQAKSHAQLKCFCNVPAYSGYECSSKTKEAQSFVTDRGLQYCNTKLADLKNEMTSIQCEAECERITDRKYLIWCKRNPIVDSFCPRF